MEYDIRRVLGDLGGKVVGPVERAYELHVGLHTEQPLPRGTEAGLIINHHDPQMRLVHASVLSPARSDRPARV